MAYRLELTRHAERILWKIHAREPALYKRLSRALDDIEKDPFLGKPLKGVLSSRYSFRVGDYRIVYTIRRNVLLIIVIDMGHRRDIYR